MSWPAVILWVVILAAALQNGPLLIYVLMMSAIFGSLQMLPGDAGGVNLLPLSLCAVFCNIKVLSQRGNLTRAAEVAFDPSRLCLFTFFLIYSLFGAIILPRAFSGFAEVVPVSAFKGGASVLAPNGGNFTQSAYMSLSYGTACCFAVLGSNRSFRLHFARAALVSGIALCLSGLVDLVTYRLGVGFVLDPFRTASYSMLTETEAMGAKRVVGLTPEASTYAGLCIQSLALLAFLRPFYTTTLENVMVIGAILCLVAMTCLSTSSGGYVGLAFFLLLYFYDLLMRVSGKGYGRVATARREIWLICALILIVFASIIAAPEIYTPAIDLVYHMVFEKTESSSYAERSLWTRVGWQAFVDSGGVGVGLGSVRTSNWLVSILASTGIFGALLMFGFLLQVYVKRYAGADKSELAYLRALKLSLLPTFLMYQLSGTIPDIGVTAAAVLGILCSDKQRFRARDQTVANRVSD